MNKAIALIMTAILTLSLTACSSDTTPDSTPAPSSTSPSSARQSAGGASQPASDNASSAAADTPATDKTSVQDFVGAYIQAGTDNSFVLTDTYQFTNIKVIDPIYNNEDNSGREVSSVFGVADVVGGTVKISTNYGCNLVANFNGDGSITLFLMLGDKQFTGKFIPADQAPKELSDFSDMAGSYKGDWSTLTIQTNGAFTYEHNSDSLKKIFTGQLPTGLKNGDKVQSNDYTIVFRFSQGSSNMSIDVKDAGGTSVGGDDLVRES